MREWVNILPNGDLLIGGMGLKGGMRETQNQGIPFLPEIFSRERNPIIIWHWNCPIDQLTFLAKNYPYIPYPAVALADCLKQRGDVSWREKAEKAQILLGKLRTIHPHPIEIDNFYETVTALLKD